MENTPAISRLGSFYLRVGAVAFGIGSMVYSGLEFGQYFELKGICIQSLKKKNICESHSMEFFLYVCLQAIQLVKMC